MWMLTPARVAPLHIQCLANSLGKAARCAKYLGHLPPTWETWNEHPAPAIGLAQVQLLHGWKMSLSLFLLSLSLHTLLLFQIK